ncbi:MAG TPA: ABC transporter ATP-binding protein [Steroidobacteraceae bacterium]|nr:ABC transporter ATP-binding protein [Steroidobacteraceae bacterium]
MPTPKMDVAIEFTGVTRTYGEVRAVDNVSFSVQSGEFFAMLGPSGSGKTTCLRLIAGFEQPDSGTVALQGREVTQDPPYLRDVNTVFQDYALFPHLSVAENVAYSLRVRGIDKAEQVRRATQALELVKLSGMSDRRPAQLSGGQRQRVALARALVNQPRVLLLDEPLGALDLKLREEMQIELKNLQRRLGITFVFVTHDQGEALSMADRIAVFNHGRIEQLDTPRALYTRPKTEFVARFVGSSNVVTGTIATALAQCNAFSIRPEHIRIAPSVDATDSIEVNGKLEDVQYHGASSRLHVRLSGGPLLVAAVPESDQTIQPQLGGEVSLSWLKRDMVVLE